MHDSAWIDTPNGAALIKRRVGVIATHPSANAESLNVAAGITSAQAAGYTFHWDAEVATVAFWESAQ